MLNKHKFLVMLKCKRTFLDLLFLFKIISEYTCSECFLLDRIRLHVPAESQKKFNLL